MSMRRRTVRMASLAALLWACACSGGKTDPGDNAANADAGAANDAAAETDAGADTVAVADVPTDAPEAAPDVAVAPDTGGEAVDGDGADAAGSTDATQGGDGVDAPDGAVVPDGSDPVDAAAADAAGKSCTAVADCPAPTGNCKQYTCHALLGCLLVSLPDGAACSDGNACTDNDQCGGGGCKAGAMKDCTDDYDCTIASCNPDTGNCEFPPVAVGTPCNDGNACTAGDSCMGTACVPGASVCQCQKDADCAGKADGDLCKGTFFCDLTGNTCKINPLTVVTCSGADDTACSVNKCDPKTGTCAATPVNDQGACSDGDKCSTGDHCSAGQCVGGTNVCECKADKDCASQEDGNACNGTLFCDVAKGLCKPNPTTVVTCPTAGDTVCSANLCNPATGKCAMTPVGGSKACDDGDVCTVGDHCAAGACVAGTDTCQCKADKDCASLEDGNLCNGTLFCDVGSHTCKLNPKTVVTCVTVDDTSCSKVACQPKTGQCQPVALPDGATCDADGNPCTVKDGCQKGVCQADVNVCDCQQTAECFAKEDGNLCNGTLFCDKTVNKCMVQPKTVVFCPYGKDTACLENTCTPQTGACSMQIVNETKACDADGNPCTVLDTCQKGQCVADANTCQCQQDGDCAAVEDGNPCNGKLYCDKASFKCQVLQPSVVTCPSVNDSQCAMNLCDPKTGSCAMTPVFQNKHCDADQDACTAFDTCKDGKCLLSVDLCACQVDSHCGEFDDGNLCNGIEFCSKAGPKPACKPLKSSEVVCGPAGSPCEVLECATDSGKCLAKPGGDGKACDDGDACTGSDLCAGGACAGKALDPKACDDKNPCTDDACDPKKGCVGTANTAPCDDGSVCTSGEACVASKCGGGTQKTCDDGLECTTDGCEAAKGCTATAIAGCVPKVKLPFSDAFDCGKASPWTFAGGTGPVWAIDDSPSIPAAKSPTCSLNFNNGKDFACTSKLDSSVVSPVFDATSIGAAAGLHVAFSYAGKWENGSYDNLELGGSLDGKSWTVLGNYDSPSGWLSVNVALAAYAGKAFQLRFRFWTLDCIGNEGGGAFIDDLTVAFNACKDDGGCDDKKACTVNSCDVAKGTCSFAFQADDAKCDDGNACTADACDAGTGGCKNAPVGDGGACTDGSACTTGDACKAGACATKAKCDDGNACTADACDASTAACTNTAKVCDDKNVCTKDACDKASGSCTAANDDAADPGGTCTLVDECATGKPACSAGKVVCAAGGAKAEGAPCKGGTGTCKAAVCYVPLPPLVVASSSGGAHKPGEAAALSVTTSDGNSDSAKGIDDIAGVTADLSGFGGAKDAALQDKGQGANAQQKVWGGSVDTSGLAAGTHLVTVTVTDKGGAKATQVVPVYVYSGKLVEVGADKPLTSIKAAIAEAVAGDAIVLGDGTYGGTSNKNLTLGGKDLVLVGKNGPGAVTIDCANAGRFLNLANSGETLTATIAGVTIKNCAAGAIKVVADQPGAKAAVTLVDVRLEDNVSGEHGAAVQVVGAGATVSMVLTLLKNNSAKGYSGGGAYVASGATLLAVDSVFEGNKTLQTSGVYNDTLGGAIHAIGNSKLDFTRTRFTANQVVGTNPGTHGVHANDCTTTLTDCIFEKHNRLALRAAGGSVTFQGGMVRDNVETAIQLFDLPMAMNGTVLSGNGEALFLSGAFSKLKEVTFLNNVKAFVVGGNVQTGAGKFEFDGGLVKGNNVAIQSPATLSVSSVVRKVRFEGNTGASGGAAATYSGASLKTFEDCEFIGNTSTSQNVVGGGALYVSGNIDIRNCTFSKNKANNGGAIAFWGAGFYATDPFTAVFENLLFVDNTATGKGGAVYRAGNPNVTITFSGITATGNTAAQGGAFWGDKGTLALRRSIVWGNSDTATGEVSADQFGLTNDAAVKGSIEWSLVDNGDGDIYDPGLRINAGDGFSGGSKGNLESDPLFVPGKGIAVLLSQVGSGGAKTSPAVDPMGVGAVFAKDVWWGVGSTRTDGKADEGTLDFGWHVLP